MRSRREGVDRARQAQTVSDLMLVVLDGCAATRRARSVDHRRDAGSTKADRREQVGSRRAAWSASRRAARGVRNDAAPDSTACAAICIEALDVEPLSDAPAITNVRHIALLVARAGRLVAARSTALRTADPVGGVRPRGSAGGAGALEEDDRTPDARRRARAIFEVLYRKIRRR